MTTAGEDAGWPGGEGGRTEDERVLLSCARSSFIRLAQTLDGEIRRLVCKRAGDADRAEAKALTELIRETQRALLIVLDFERRMGSQNSAEVDGALDLEAARAEITGRLDRLAERG